MTKKTAIKKHGRARLDNGKQDEKEGSRKTTFLANEKPENKGTLKRRTLKQSHVVQNSSKRVPNNKGTPGGSEKSLISWKTAATARQRDA